MIGLMLAHAGDAEGDRLAEALYVAARDGEWRAVERRYARLMSEHPAGLDGRVHQFASQAARSRGELLQATQRLMRVRPQDAVYDAVQSDLEVIEDTAGLTMVALPACQLQPAAMPFGNDLRLAVERATTILAEDGIFVGMLPAGDYTCGATTFDIRAGFRWNVVFER